MKRFSNGILFLKINFDVLHTLFNVTMSYGDLSYTTEQFTTHLTNKVS